MFYILSLDNPFYGIKFISIENALTVFNNKQLKKIVNWMSIDVCNNDALLHTLDSFKNSAPINFGDSLIELYYYENDEIENVDELSALVLETILLDIPSTSICDLHYAEKIYD